MEKNHPIVSIWSVAFRCNNPWIRTSWKPNFIVGSQLYLTSYKLTMDQGVCILKEKNCHCGRIHMVRATSNPFLLIYESGSSQLCPRGPPSQCPRIHFGGAIDKSICMRRIGFLSSSFSSRKLAPTIGLAMLVGFRPVNACFITSL